MARRHFSIFASGFRDKSELGGRQSVTTQQLANALRSWWSALPALSLVHDHAVGPGIMPPAITCFAITTFCTSEDAITRRGRIIAATEMKPHFEGSIEAEKQ
jgi:hypothetical protein